MEHLKEMVDYGIMGTLGLMSFISLWFVIERFLTYRKINIETYEKKEQLEIDLSNNLSLIATIGSNAPYVGLLGTVISIMLTFYTLGDGGIVDPKEIMSGLALALKATAAGLLVAIPSMVFYNLLSRRMDVLVATWEMSHEDAKV